MEKIPKYAGKDWPGEAGVKTFAQEYVIDFNAIAAVYRANLRPGRKTAKKIAIELLNLESVNMEIRRLLDESEKHSIITKSRVESALWREANASLENGSSRVSALTQLCRVKGYNHESEREFTLKGKSPVINLTVVEKDESGLL